MYVSYKNEGVSQPPATSVPFPGPLLTPLYQDLSHLSTITTSPLTPGLTLHLLPHFSSFEWNSRNANLAFFS